MRHAKLGLRGRSAVRRVCLADDRIGNDARDLIVVELNIDLVFVSTPPQQNRIKVRDQSLICARMCLIDMHSVYTLSTVGLSGWKFDSVLTRVCRDMPPAGGFEALKYKRNLPLRGPGAYAILGGVTAICAFGFWRLGKGNLERR